MDYEQLIKTRYSVRAYTGESVAEDDLHAVLEAARLAPTAANRQPFKLLVLRTTGREAELKRIYGRSWFAKAPIVICACGLRAHGWTRQDDGKNYTDVDVAIAMDHLILAAANRGLGTCWIGAFDLAATREVLQLPDDWEPIALTPLGWPADQPREKARKELAELVVYLDSE